MFWLFEIPLAYALAKGLGIGPGGIFLAITIAFSTLAVVSLDLQTGQMESQDCLITLEIYEP